MASTTASTTAVQKWCAKRCQLNTWSASTPPAAQEQRDAASVAIQHGAQTAHAAHMTQEPAHLRQLSELGLHGAKVAVKLAHRDAIVPWCRKHMIRGPQLAG